MNLVAKESRIGLGAFSKVEMKAGELIVDWSRHPLFQIPIQIPKGWRFKSIGPGLLSGPIGPEEYPDAYINHSCEPNAEIIFQRPKIHLVARRAIAADQEVTFDYATLYQKPWMMTCKCGTEACRKIIRGK